MLLNLILTALLGATGIILFEKWKVDDYMNTHPVFSRYWTENPCLLCRGFWMGVICFVCLIFVPFSVYLFVPLAVIPIQVWLVKITNNASNNE